MRYDAARWRWRASVFDLDKKETTRGGGGAGGGAIASGEDGWDFVGVEGGVDKGTDEVTNHVMEEAGARDSVDEEVFLLVPVGVVDGACVVGWDDRGVG